VVLNSQLLSIDATIPARWLIFNQPAAQAAIARTLTACGVASIDAAIAACPGLHPATATSPAGPATISDFAGNGLDSLGDLFGGGACVPNSATATSPGFQCVFGGLNPNIGAVPLLQPVGRSVYNAMGVKLVGNKNNLMMGVKHANFQVSIRCLASPILAARIQPFQAIPIRTS
jgi:hypothetical protein